MADTDQGGAGKTAPWWDPTFGWFLLVFFLLNVGQGVYPPLLPQIMEDLGLSFATAGLIGTGYGLARSFVDMPAGMLMERLGVPRVLHIALALLAGGSALSALAPSFLVMVLARALLGVGSGMTMVVSILYLMRRASSGHQGRRANIYEVAVIAGMAVSADLGGMIGSRWGWRWSFAVGTGIMVLAWIVAARTLLPAIRGLLEDRPVADAPITQPQAAPTATPGALFAIYVLVFSQSVAWGGGISTLFPLYGGRELGLSPGTLGRIMAIAFWVEVLLLLPVGWAMDTWGKLRVLIPGFFAMLVGCLLGPFTFGTLAYGAAYTLLVGGMSVWMAAPGLLAERLGPRFRGKAAGTYRLAIDLAMIIAPGLVGWLIDIAGFRTAGVVLSLSIAVSLALSFGFLRGRSGTAAC
jgi:MFS family permease